MLLLDFPLVVGIEVMGLQTGACGLQAAHRPHL